MKLNLGVIALATVALGLSVFAQPPAPEGRKEPRTDAKQKGSGKTYRSVLQRRIEETRQRLTAMEEGMKRLDAGEDPGKVRESLDNAGGGRRMVGSRPFLPERVSDESRPGGEMGNPPPNAPLTPEERERALRFLDEHLPRVAEKMRSLAQDNPPVLDRLLMRMRPKLIDLGNTLKYDQSLFELKVRELQAAMQVMEASKPLREAGEGSDREALKSTLREAVAEHFDIQLLVSEREAERLADRIGTLREEIAERKARRDEFIERELDATIKGHRPGRDGPRSGDSDRREQQPRSEDDKK